MSLLPFLASNVQIGEKTTCANEQSFPNMVKKKSIQLWTECSAGSVTVFTLISPSGTCILYNWVHSQKFFPHCIFIIHGTLPWQVK